MKLRNQLNRVLHDRGLAEGEVALVARLDQGHLNRIKNGRVKPTLVTALRISQAMTQGITARISELQDHFKAHKKDHASRRGLLLLVGKRNRLLKYLASTDRESYLSLIKRLGLRK